MFKFSLLFSLVPLLVSAGANYIMENFESSDESIICTPPNIVQAAKETSYILLPETSSDILPILVGDEASPGQFPFMATIIKDNSRPWCCGVIINKRFVLSNGNCCEGYQSQYSIRTGSRSATSGGVISRILKIYYHPKRDYNKVDHALLLILLNDELQFGTYTQAVKLPKSKLTIDRGTEVTTVGYSFMWPYRISMKYYPNQHYFNTTVANFEMCSARSVNDTTRNDTVLCTELGRYGIEPCCLQWGIPLLTSRKSILIGINYYGTSLCYGGSVCHTNTRHEKPYGPYAQHIYNEKEEPTKREPVMFTNIMRNRNWITDITGL